MREPLAWVTEDDKFDKILAIGKDSIFVADAAKDELYNAQDMVRTGSDPKRVLPRGYTEYGQAPLLDIRHLRDSRRVTIRYVGKGDKPHKFNHIFGDKESAAEAVLAIAKAMKLSTEPRREKATIAAITWGPLVTAAAAIALPLRLLTRVLARALMMVLTAIVLLGAIAYWTYRLVNRPVVDVYPAVIR